MRSTHLCALLIAIGAFAHADPAVAQVPGEPDALSRFEQRISTLEPEFAADLLLGLAGSGELSPARRHEVLQRALLLARSAQEPVRRVLVPVDPAAVDPRDTALGAGYALGLDTQSLQARAIRALVLAGHGDEAIQYLREAAVEVRACSCEDSFCAVAFPYYQALTAVLDRAYSQEHRQNGDRLTQIAYELARLKASAQIGPLLDTLVSADLEAGELAATMPALRRSLASIAAEGRTLQPFATGISNGVESLARKLKAKGLPADDLVEGYQAFVKTQLSSAPCSGAERAHAAATERLRTHFNTTVRPLASQPVPEIEPVKAPASIPRSVGTGTYRRSSEAQRLLADVTSLQAQAKQAMGEGQADSDWEDAASRLLSRIDTWTDSGDADSSYLEFQRAYFYLMIVQSAPSGSSVASDASRRLVQGLGRYDLQRAKRLPWFVLFRLVRDHIKVLPSAERDDWIERLRSTGNSTILAYLDLSRG